MRWDELFTDLEAQLEQAQAAELAGEVADRTRRESSLLRLSDRLGAAVGHELVVHCEGAGPVTGRLTEVGPDWLLLEEPSRNEVLANAVHLVDVVGLTAATEQQDGKVWRALDLAWALRGLARSRVAVQVVQCSGAQRSGTLDRVGADFVELAEHPPGEQRRRTSVHQVVVIPIAAISVVRSLR
ncbi:MAG: hypothetical protein JWM40_207 [Frankiales bacterium]|nr:hypothetical protein [Frankiales bacterium]